jgi:hypothetical protein
LGGGHPTLPLASPAAALPASPAVSPPGHRQPSATTPPAPSAQATDQAPATASASKQPRASTASATNPPATPGRPSATSTRVAPTAAPPSATSAPAPTAAVPTTQTIGRDIVWISGTGETGTDDVELAPGLLIVHIDHQRATPFALYLMNAAGDHLALLANHTTAFAGTRAYGIKEPGRYYLHVIAEDGWRAGLEQPAGALGQLPGELSGAGPVVLAPRQLAAGSHTLTWSHGGTLAFEIQLLTPDGGRVAAPVIATGAGEGSTTFELSADGAYLFDVDADGPWQLTLDP